jgi:hypothetical protein
MSENVESAPAPAPGGNSGYKKGLPLAGLPKAEAAALELWRIARLGMASNDAYAVQLGGTKASGGGWRTRIAILRGFKLIKTDGDRIGLSPLGQALVNSSDPAAQTAARRTALLSLRSYADLVSSFEGTELPDISVLATRLQFEYGKTPDVALKAAKAFVGSLRHAKMIDESDVLHKGGVDAGAIPDIGRGEDEHVATAEALDSDITHESPADEDATATELDQAFAANPSILDEQPVHELATYTIDGASVARSSTTISVTLDLSNFRAEEVVQILNALKGM